MITYSSLIASIRNVGKHPYTTWGSCFFFHLIKCFFKDIHCLLSLRQHNQSHLNHSQIRITSCINKYISGLCEEARVGLGIDFDFCN